MEPARPSSPLPRSDALIQVTPLSPVIGAEVSGLDLAEPLEPDVVDALRSALTSHLVLFFREQPISQAQHIAFGRCFGTLHIHPAAPKDAEHPEILVVHGDDQVSFVAGSVWHSDVSCDTEPPMGSILRVEQVPDVGGDTLFANMYAAFEALSPPMRRLLSGLTAIHEGERYYRDRYGSATLRDASYPVAEHPVVRTHPITGRQALYVNEGFTTRIKDLPLAESDVLLAFLFKHLAQPQFHCRFHWRAHSMAFWDNRCTQHLAIWDYWPQTRHAYRVTVQGDRPFYEPVSD